MNPHELHDCGGVILSGGSGETAHEYCDRCRAFRYLDSDDGMPTGTDAAANREAWDAGDDRSPEVRA